MAEVATRNLETTRPSLTVSTLAFSGGTIVELGPHDVVVLVGPNNSGKSAALRQIQESLGGGGKYNVVTSCQARKVGTPKEFEEHVRSTAQRVIKHGTWHYVGYKFEFYASDVAREYEKQASDSVRDFFVLRCSTDDRLSGSNPVRSIAYRREQPSHPIHLLVMDRKIEERIGESFSRAFGEHLYVNRAEGSEVTLYVSGRKPKDVPLDAFSADAIQFFQQDANPLNHQGDGMRAFATMALNTLAISQQTVLLIDEPEAFLHPPQARLLGRVMVSQDRELRQTFIATHSSDVLKGILETSNRNVHILRITRDGAINNVYSLDPKLASKISRDPVVRYSGVFDVIFFKHAVFCESDTDCQFYGGLLDYPEVSGEVRPDVLFVQSSGKHRIVKLASIAKSLGVPFSIIVDIDALSEKSLFRGLTEVAGIQWSAVEALWRDVTNAINAQKARLSLSQVVASVEESIAKLRSGELVLSDFLAGIREIARTNSPWEMVKRGGRSALPMGDTVEKFDQLLAVCSERGLWVVPVGELEGFCRSIGGTKGSAWMAKLLETHDLAKSVELEDAREFVGRIWKQALS